MAKYLKMRTMGMKDSNLQRSSSVSFDVNEYTIETYNIEDSQAYYIVSRRKLYSVTSPPMCHLCGFRFL